MTKFSQAKQFEHGKKERVAILMVQLGTPDAPEPGAVRRYLKQFLSDPRVVEIPKLLWWLILNVIILNTRPKKSAAKYRAIWTKEGSPLLVNSKAQAKLLQGYLGERGHEVIVALGMRYGNPGIPEVMRQLREKNVTKLLVLPMYPQYAAATTATGMDEVFRELATWRNQPELRAIRSFHKDPAYIGALATQVRKHWEREQSSGGRAKMLLLSFHGVPERSLHLGDPYHCECYVTARLLAEKLELDPKAVRVTFQSRFGRAKWLQPYTEATLKAFPTEGISQLDVMCPGFVSDCLETLEEIAIEGKETFKHAGGLEYRYIPCLNDAPEFIKGLADLCERHLLGWPSQRLSQSAESERSAALAQQKQAAQELGAKKSSQ
jgi:protoporphyrin/coproporphyrin ferrochelatase